MSSGFLPHDLKVKDIFILHVIKARIKSAANWKRTHKLISRKSSKHKISFALLDICRSKKLYLVINMWISFNSRSLFTPFFFDKYSRRLRKSCTDWNIQRVRRSSSRVRVNSSRNKRGLFPSGCTHTLFAHNVLCVCVWARRTSLQQRTLNSITA